MTRAQVDTNVYTTCLRVVQFPAVALDLLDGRGRVDHKKLVPFVAIIALLALLAYQVVALRQPLTGWSAVLAIFLLAAAFGPRLYGMALSRSSFTLGATAAVSSAVSEARTDVRSESRSESTVRVELPSDRDYDWAAGIDRRQA